MAENNSGTPKRTCSFCGRGEGQVMFLIPSPTGLYICDNCIDACNDIIYDHVHAGTERKDLTRENLPKPEEIKSKRPDDIA